MEDLVDNPGCSFKQEHLLMLCVSSASDNVKRRRAVRKSWFAFKTGPDEWIPADKKQAVRLLFVVSGGTPELMEEQKEHGDMMLVDVDEGYHHLWRKTLRSLQMLEDHQYAYYMHADDDSYVRLDLILQLLMHSPREKFYWGYIWDGTGNRVTAPIRNPANKSHMPVQQYALDYYPPFASGCGFILSRDLVQALLKQPLPDYRLLDPPFGIHLCGSDYCVLPDGPIQPVHDERVRPYRGIPIFKPTTIVQHYLTAEEMVPFHRQVIATLQEGNLQVRTLHGQQYASTSLTTASSDTHQDQEPPNASAADELYAELVQLGLLRR